eukprot:scaffold257526_cov28-Tisochrysis_lutea.AAC.1
MHLASRWSAPPRPLSSPDLPTEGGPRANLPTRGIRCQTKRQRPPPKADQASAIPVADGSSIEHDHWLGLGQYF